MTIKYWTQEEDDKLKQLYQDKRSKAETLSAFKDRTYAAIKYRAKHLGIKKLRIQYKNELFFEIPNELNCSVAGFLASDGCLMPTPPYPPKMGNRINLTCAKKDVQSLEDVKIATNSNVNILYATTQRLFNFGRCKKTTPTTCCAASLCFSSCKKWIEHLNKNWNLTPKKNLTLEPPLYIYDLNLKLAYASGVISGDASIG